MNEVLFSSNTDDWATPQDLFDALDAEFHFTLDPCSSEQNHKCDRYFTKEDNGLLHDWGGGESVFCNPPYGKEMYKWVDHCTLAVNYIMVTVIVQKSFYLHHSTG